MGEGVMLTQFEISADKREGLEAWFSIDHPAGRQSLGMPLSALPDALLWLEGAFAHFASEARRLGPTKPETWCFVVPADDLPPLISEPVHKPVLTEIARRYADEGTTEVLDSLISPFQALRSNREIEEASADCPSAEEAGIRPDANES
jgi:hypothetical protein